jgi:hypothetical protein
MGDADVMVRLMHETGSNSHTVLSLVSLPRVDALLSEFPRKYIRPEAVAQFSREQLRSVSFPSVAKMRAARKETHSRRSR